MPPNIVFIITDNQSPWTLGCYGNGEIRTPNVDRLAAEGVRFTRSYCVNPVCSPNRATYLTGLIPSQHGVHNWLGEEIPDAQVGPGAYCTIGEFATLPQILAGEGYLCGMSGKWHLGDSLNPQVGFTYWYAKPRGHTVSFYDADAIWQGRIAKEPGYTLEAITDHAIDFLQQQSGPDRASEAPFFLYVGYNGPYGLDQDLRTGHRNRHATYYADRDMRSFPGEDAHPWLVQNRDCINNVDAARNYATAVSGIDDEVGRILTALADFGLADNTLVIFTADHGLSAGHHGYWGMADHGRPLAMYEENMQVPLIWWHPRRLPSGGIAEAPTCNYDFFPSILDYLGIDRPAAGSDARPGVSYAPALEGTPGDSGERTVFFEYENTRTIRTPRWKYTQRYPDGPDDLYDLIADPGERENLVDRPHRAAIRSELKCELGAFFERYADPRYDLWRGGTTKAGRAIPEASYGTGS